MIWRILLSGFLGVAGAIIGMIAGAQSCIAVAEYFFPTKPHSHMIIPLSAQLGILGAMCGLGVGAAIGLKGGYFLGARLDARRQAAKAAGVPIASNAEVLGLLLVSIFPLQIFFWLMGFGPPSALHLDARYLYFFASCSAPLGLLWCGFLYFWKRTRHAAIGLSIGGAATLAWLGWAMS